MGLAGPLCRVREKDTSREILSPAATARRRAVNQEKSLLHSRGFSSTKPLQLCLSPVKSVCPGPRSRPHSSHCGERGSLEAASRLL